MEGCINVVSSTPVRNTEFMKAVRKNVNFPFGIPLPKVFLKIGAAIIGTETELILKSRNVVPERLNNAGFTFKYVSLQDALSTL